MSTLKSKVCNRNDSVFNWFPCRGSTLYMEPEPVVQLNNAEARLGAAQEEEEAAILLRLSRQASGHGKKKLCSQFGSPERNKYPATTS